MYFEVQRLLYSRFISVKYILFNNFLLENMCMSLIDGYICNRFYFIGFVPIFTSNTECQQCL